jgi:hypothetical protein
MTADDGDDVRLWLVDRQYHDKNLITLVYATTDGEWYLRKQLSHHLLQRKPVTAAVTVPADRPEPTPPEDRERYATQADRMATDHDPDDTV